MTKCLYSDRECESNIINSKTCDRCLIIRNTELLDELNERLEALEKKTAKKPPTKRTGRTKKVELTG